MYKTGNAGWDAQRERKAEQTLGVGYTAEDVDNYIKGVRTSLRKHPVIKDLLDQRAITLARRGMDLYVLIKPYREYKGKPVEEVVSSIVRSKFFGQCTNKWDMVLRHNMPKDILKTYTYCCIIGADFMSTYVTANKYRKSLSMYDKAKKYKRV